jgi:tetratricopeptide (TPR) repeat protein
VQFDVGQFLAARDSFAHSLANWTKADPSDPDRATPMLGLESAYLRMGQFKKAEAIGRVALEIREEELGAANPGIAGPLQSLAAVLQAEHRYLESQCLFTRALDVLDQEPESTVTALVHSNLGMLLEEMHQPQAAIKEVQIAIHIWEAVPGPRLAMGLTNLATLYCRQGNWSAAREPIARAQTLVIAAFGPDHPMLDPILSTYAAVLKHLLCTHWTQAAIASVSRNRTATGTRFPPHAPSMCR